MNWTTDQITEARGTISALAEYQMQTGLSNGKLVQEFPYLGSTKTWTHRLLAESLEGLHPLRTLERLRKCSAVLAGNSPDADFYRTPFSREIETRVTRLERQTSDRRILAVLAPPGTGKTMTAKWAVAQRPRERSYCQIRDTWKNKSLHLANGLRRALGAAVDEANAAAAEQSLVVMLSSQTRTLFIDQAHEGGAALMHMLRVLVDETPSRFVYMGYDTAFRQVLVSTNDAYIESRAFNRRCMRPVFDDYKAGTKAGDVEAFLSGAAGLPVAVSKGIAARLIQGIQQHGNLSILADGVQAAQAASEGFEANAEAIIQHTLSKAGLDPASILPTNDDN